MDGKLVSNRFSFKNSLIFTFGPILLRYCPYIGEIMKTTSSKTPKTKPYSVAFAPFFSAS
jgi:hypothetical protein